MPLVQEERNCSESSMIAVPFTNKDASEAGRAELSRAHLVLKITVPGKNGWNCPIPNEDPIPTPEPGLPLRR
jgi:hypothetical protein